MTIKDVEKLTGLTAKSIRYYESKDLITVERNEENSYRSYSENEVNRLKWIKLFRYLDFSIEEIRQLLDKEEEELKEALQNKAETFSNQKEVCENKQEMCLALAKNYKEDPQLIEEYNEAIEFLESDEMAEVMEELKDFGCPNLPSTITSSFILLAPVFWLFYNIHNGIYGGLTLNAICALAGTGLVTFNWIHYVTKYRRQKNRVKKQNKEWAWMAPVLIIVCIVGIVATLAAVVLLEKLLAPENYLFYEYHPVAEVVMIWLIMIPVILICLLLTAKITGKDKKQMEKMNDIIYIWNHLGKCRGFVIALWMVGIYCCVTNVNFVTEDSIICCTPTNPKGVVYEYSEIESISTGFGDKNFAIAEYKRKGNFFYQITLDGRIITFHVPNVNEDIERYQEDSYLELEEFDQALRKLKIPKKASEKGYENCELDQEFVDRFLRIINTK